jgi:hypothetical protein
MTETKKYITESTKPNGEIVREERTVYVSKSGMEFNTAEAAYRDDIERQFHDILGPAVEMIDLGRGGWVGIGNSARNEGKWEGFEEAVKRMLNDPEPFIRLLETWNANRNS